MKPTFRLGLVILLLPLACRIDTPALVGEPAPNFRLERLEGGVVELADLRGKTVLVDFWATWCPPCVLEVPELNAFYEEHRSRGVELLAISIDEEERDFIAAWVAKRDLRYPVALGKLETAQSYGALQFPYHILISPEGHILDRLTPGFHDREELARFVAPHLQ